MKSKYYIFKLGGDNITTSHNIIFKHLLGYSKLDLTTPEQWNGFEYHSIQMHLALRC